MVNASGTDRGSTYIINVEFADMFDMDIELVDTWELAGDDGEGVFIGLVKQAPSQDWVQ